jgi:pimeloyl-ACP methyl ester carboxylesterase
VHLNGHDSVGTAASVRDIVTIADTLYGSDKDINFYGVGFSTHMGLMLTQMFPDRVGKVILDGMRYSRIRYLG